MSSAPHSASLYDLAVPGIVQTLKGTAKIIDKALAHCEARGIDPTVLVNYRLAPDMFAFARQIQIATDQAKGMVARLAGVDIPTYVDDETTMAELKARVEKTLAFIEMVPREAIESGVDKTIVLKIRDNTFEMVGHAYVSSFVMPNFYFHAATAYDILRHAGVSLIKADFLARS